MRKSQYKLCYRVFGFSCGWPILVVFEIKKIELIREIQKLISVPILIQTERNK
jgi:hypothetical protein